MGKKNTVLEEKGDKVRSPYMVENDLSMNSNSSCVNNLCKDFIVI
jgi:hypothetical protein